MKSFKQPVLVWSPGAKLRPNGDAFEVVDSQGNRLGGGLNARNAWMMDYYHLQETITVTSGAPHG